MQGNRHGHQKRRHTRLRADFDAEHDVELGCVAGELLLPLPWMPAPSGWSFAARPSTCNHGLVPTEYLEIIPCYVHVPCGGGMGMDLGSSMGSNAEPPPLAVMTAGAGYAAAAADSAPKSTLV